MLRRSDVLLGQGKSLAEVCRELSISDVTYYRWRKAYGA
ncbi:MAG: transposase [Holosporales bacterium]|nr:transposase [Holosporales bacterium]